LSAALPASTAESSTNTPGRSCCSLDPGTCSFTGKSVYQVESTWRTDQEKQIKLGALAGRPQVVAMFFAHCQYACPIIVNDMKRIESALGEEQATRIGFTLVSLDPMRDTPAALWEYRHTRDLPGKNWTLLCGDPDDVLELAAVLGVRYRADANGQIAH